MGCFFNFLNQLVDDSDPIQISISFNIYYKHLKQYAMMGILIGWCSPDCWHDMGKVLCLFGEPQWAVVGDTFRLAVVISDKVVYPEFFSNNPDYSDERYNTKQGVYEPGCGLRNVHMSWGHDEYVYQMVKDRLPEEALYMLPLSFFLCMAPRSSV